MWIDPMQVVGDDAELRVLRGCGYLSCHDTAACRPAAASPWQGRIGRVDMGFRLVRTMYPPTSGHESTASRHAP
jgi:hypothetical protein